MPDAMSAATAERIALTALGWLAGEEALSDAFLGATGASAGDLAAGAEDPTLQAAVLEFLTTDDAWVRAFCDAHGLGYHDPWLALQSLPGAGRVHWT
ncbi:MAG: DUF3572 domain-containing protein [Paracoccaceae bacterium]